MTRTIWKTPSPRFFICMRLAANCVEKVCGWQQVWSLSAAPQIDSARLAAGAGDAVIPLSHRRGRQTDRSLTTSAATTSPSKQKTPACSVRLFPALASLNIAISPSCLLTDYGPSLLCPSQMNHKPIPYAIAICWWAQAVLVGIKSRDYEKLDPLWMKKDKVGGGVVLTFIT